MRRFARATIVGTAAELEASRLRLLQELGPEALVDAAAIVAFFNALDRVADATGTQIDEGMREMVDQLVPTVDVPAVIRADPAELRKRADVTDLSHL